MGKVHQWLNAAGLCQMVRARGSSSRLVDLPGAFCAPELLRKSGAHIPRVSSLAKCRNRLRSSTKNSVALASCATQTCGGHPGNIATNSQQSEK